jgi:hypothetical protein
MKGRKSITRAVVIKAWDLGLGQSGIGKTEEINIWMLNDAHFHSLCFETNYKGNKGHIYVATKFPYPMHELYPGCLSYY